MKMKETERIFCIFFSVCLIAFVVISLIQLKHENDVAEKQTKCVELENDLTERLK